MAYDGNEYGQGHGGASYEVVVIKGSFFSSNFNEDKIQDACEDMHARGMKLVGSSSVDMCGACFCMCKKPSLTLIFGPM